MFVLLLLLLIINHNPLSIVSEQSKSNKIQQLALLSNKGLGLMHIIDHSWLILDKVVFNFKFQFKSEEIQWRQHTSTVGYHSSGQGRRLVLGSEGGGGSLVV